MFHVEQFPPVPAPRLPVFQTYCLACGGLFEVELRQARRTKFCPVCVQQRGRENQQRCKVRRRYTDLGPRLSRALERMSIDEVCQATGWSRGQVLYSERRALRQLRAHRDVMKRLLMQVRFYPDESDILDWMQGHLRQWAAAADLLAAEGLAAEEAEICGLIRLLDGEVQRAIMNESRKSAEGMETGEEDDSEWSAAERAYRKVRREMRLASASTLRWQLNP